MARPILRDPEVCPRCGGNSQVIDTKRTAIYRWRRRRCLILTCVNMEGRRTVWRTYESLINPDGVRLRAPNQTT